MPKNQGSAGDKSPARNYTKEGTTDQTVDAVTARVRNASFTAKIVGVPAKSNALKTTSP